MTKINLKDFYPDFYKSDYTIDVPNELAEQFYQWERDEAAYQRRTYRHRAHYSLDRGDGIELEAVFVSLSPCEIYERKVTMEQLHAAIAALPDKQAKRLYAHYFVGMSKAEIARAEGVSENAVKDAIVRGLKNMERILKDIR